jgi:hypothetical protein
MGGLQWGRWHLSEGLSLSPNASKSFQTFTLVRAGSPLRKLTLWWQKRPPRHHCWPSGSGNTSEFTPNRRFLPMPIHSGLSGIHPISSSASWWQFFCLFILQVIWVNYLHNKCPPFPIFVGLLHTNVLSSYMLLNVYSVSYAAIFTHF